MGATFAVQDAHALTIGFGPIGVTIPGGVYHPGYGYPGPRRPHTAGNGGHSEPDNPNPKAPSGGKTADGGKGADTGAPPHGGKGSQVANGPEGHGPDLTPEQ